MGACRDRSFTSREAVIDLRKAANMLNIENLNIDREALKIKCDKVHYENIKHNQGRTYYKCMTDPLGNL